MTDVAIPVIYLDIVWLLNFVMDGVLLWMTLFVIRRPVRWKRLLLGALFGAFYSLFLFIPSLSFTTSLLGKVLASLLMVWIGIGRRNWFDLARSCLGLYFVTFLMAGAALALHFAVPGVSLASGTVITNRGIAFGTSGTILALLVAVPVSIGLVQHTIQRIRTWKLASMHVLSMQVTVQGQDFSFQALLDTGNHLSDPVTRQPVCFMDYKLLQSVLPSPLSAALQAGQDPVNALAALGDHEAGTLAFALVPYRVAGGQSNLALCLRPDALYVVCNGEKLSVPQIPWLALSVAELSREGTFQAILNPQILSGDERIEEMVSKTFGTAALAHSPASFVDAHQNPSARHSG
ncbi:sigma-E processing peptidase SpoIIGA [Alicyclobacillus tolerans]|uniref:sigma-E processing peptidase SpoIIGA n=1 Tax=Alicyclobacillus tolerans TaxID=90970 RepID=UPI003B7693F0